jgi:hypothetical protein
MDSTDTPRQLAIFFALVAALLLILFSRNSINTDYATAMEAVAGSLLAAVFFVLIDRLVGSIFKRRPLLLRLLETAKSKVHVCGITLYDIHKNPAQFKGIIRKLAAERRSALKLRFLWLDPNSRFSKRREIEEDERQTGRFARESNRTLKALKEIKSLRDGLGNVHIEYKVYNAMPAHSLIWVDDRSFMGPYLKGRRGNETRWMEIRDKATRIQLADEFKLLWRSGHVPRHLVTVKKKKQRRRR